MSVRVSESVWPKRDCKKVSDVPDGVVSSVSSSTCGNRQYDSAVACHLVENPDCAAVYSDECFTILSRVRFRRYLNVLEAIYINTRQPRLCKQRNSVTELRLFAQHSTRPPWVHVS